jgi:lytic murein transglycosylase
MRRMTWQPTTPLLPWLALAVLAGCAAPPVAPPEPPAAPPPAATVAAAPQRSFERWLAGMRETARAAGIDETTLHAAFDGVQFLPRVVELDRSQPEFTRPVWDYLDRTVTPQRVAQGRDRLAALREPADAAAARYGVPPAILMAIWGMESGYGADYGNTPTIDALASLGYEGRREDWARGQLLAALKILQHGDIARADMLGSWAGAMGQTQFMPSNYLAYAVDADGDGRRDIWHSMADVFASTAHMLAGEGWRPGEPWGAEVRLPDGFDLARADNLRQSTDTWAAEGVSSVDGTALPALAEASVLLPAGARGPAFMVGHNFRTLLRYNNSTSYALAVSLLAQRIDGGHGVQAAWPRDVQPLSRSQLRALQTALSERGFDSGGADGMMGPATREALRRWQRSVDLPADGYPTLELLQRLQAP